MKSISRSTSSYQYSTWSHNSIAMAAQLVQEASPAAAPRFSKPTLLDVPVSNNGARCRFVLYKKKLEAVVDIQSPKVLGGLRGEEYLRRNPLGKMPLLVLPDGTNLPESAVGWLHIASPYLMCEHCCLKFGVYSIAGGGLRRMQQACMYAAVFHATRRDGMRSQAIASYLVDKYQGADYGPTFALDTPEERAHDHLVQRMHDIYICSIQACTHSHAPPCSNSMAHACSSLASKGCAVRQISACTGMHVSGHGGHSAGQGNGHAGVQTGRAEWPHQGPLRQRCADISCSPWHVLEASAMPPDHADPQASGQLKEAESLSSACGHAPKQATS